MTNYDTDELMRQSVLSLWQIATPKPTIARKLRTTERVVQDIIDGETGGRQQLQFAFDAQPTMEGISER